MRRGMVSTFQVALAVVYSSLMLFAQQAPLTADAYTSGTNTTVNYGSAVVLFVAGPSNTVTATNGAGNRAWLSFDLSSLPAGTPASQVAKATLTLYADRVYALGSVDVMLAGNSWTETGITNAAAPVPGAIIATAVPVTQVGYITVDVTSAVQAWLGGTSAVAASPNDGLVLVANSASPTLAAAFDAKENTATSHPAQLNITLSGPTGPQGPIGPPGPVGPMPTGAAITTQPNTFTANQTVAGDLTVSGAIHFSDGTTQNTAPGSTAIPSGFSILGDSSTAPAGYTVTGSFSFPDTVGQVASLPVAMSYAAVSTDGSVIRVVGGNFGFQTQIPGTAIDNPLFYEAGALGRALFPPTQSVGLAYLQTFQFSSGTWQLNALDGSTGPQHKTEWASAAIDGSQGYFYTCGGFAGLSNPALIYSACESWNLNGFPWEPNTIFGDFGSNMTTPRADFGFVVASPKLYSFGGWNGTSILNSTEIFDATNSDTASKGWQPQPSPLNFARAGHASVVVGKKIYAIGGIGTDGKALNSVEMLDTSSETPAWTLIATLTTPRANAAAAVIGTKIYVFGGEGNGAADNFNQPELDSIEVLDTASANPVWQQLPVKLSTPREAMGAVSVGNTIYLIGGISAVPNPYADPSNQYLQHVLSEVVSTVETFTPGRTVYLFSKN